MFRKTDPQTSLLESRFLVSPSKRARLEKPRSQVFNVHVLPLIDEELFRAAYHEDSGRRNKSIRLLTSLHLLNEWNDLMDEEVHGPAPHQTTRQGRRARSRPGRGHAVGRSRRSRRSRRPRAPPRLDKPPPQRPS